MTAFFIGNEEPVAFVPAAGEAAGPPIQSRGILVPSSLSHGILEGRRPSNAITRNPRPFKFVAWNPGGPAAPPAAGTNVAGSK